MFGFGNDKNEKKVDSIKETSKWSAINRTFGTTDVDEVLKEYMPKLSGAILNTENFAIANNKSINILYETLLQKLKDLEEQNAETQRKNQELQEKYNALVERMASVLESDRGKGR